jgi:glycosyltransferase involved in cell wall biosynthesis
VIAGALRKLAGLVDHRVHLIGGTEFDLPGVPYVAQKWSAETEVEDLRKMQVGMVPLPVNEWNKRKFYMKTAQYMALGIPTVATPLGSNPEVVQHGVTGFLADSEEEWVEYLSLLIKDHELRLRMSHAAASAAREKYSLESNTHKIIEAFQAAVN